MTTTTTPTPKTSARNLSSLFSWNKSRQVTPLNCFLEMDVCSPRKPDTGSPTELSAFEDEHSHLSYTSLRDLLPTSRPGSPVKLKRASSPEVGSPPPEEDDQSKIWSGSDRPPIKNRLVEQAARAYLLPTSPQKTPPDQFFARYWAKLTSGNGQSENVIVPGTTGCVHGCTHGCLSCLHTLIWVDLTRVVHALFGQSRPQSLLRDHAHGSNVIMSSGSLVTPALVK